MSAPSTARNPLANVGIALGLLALILTFTGLLGLVTGALAMVASGLGIVLAVRTDVGITKAVAGLAIGLLAVIISVFVIAHDRLQGQSQDNTSRGVSQA